MPQIQGVTRAALVSAGVGGLILAFGALLGWSSVAASHLAKPVLVAAAGVALFCAILVLAATGRLERRSQQAPSAFGDHPVAAEDPADIEDATDVRVLQAQIRTLEEALEQEVGLVREPVVTPETIRGDAGEEVLRRIRATVRGLAVRMEDDPAAARVLARVEAAVDRLVFPTGLFVRPTLTNSQQVAMPTTTKLAPLAAIPVCEIAVEEAGPRVPILESVNTAMVLTTPVEAEVVLPIPARTPSPEIRRGGRWTRRSAA